MVQNNFDVSLIEIPVLTNPKVKNKLLYELSNANTDNEKTSVRKKKARILKGLKGTEGTKNPPGKNNFSTEHLTSEDLEKRLIQALNSQPNNANLLGKAIDFFIKVRDKKDVMEEEVDMDVFMKLGLSATANK